MKLAALPYTKKDVESIIDCLFVLVIEKKVTNAVSLLICVCEVLWNWIKGTVKQAMVLPL